MATAAGRIAGIFDFGDCAHGDIYHDFAQLAVVLGPVGVTFELLSPDSMELDYLNAATVGEYCGLNATLTGVWMRQNTTHD